MLLVLLFERKYSSIVGIQICNLSFKGDLENEIRKEIKDQEKLVKERVNINKAKVKELEEKYYDLYKKVILDVFQILF